MMLRQSTFGCLAGLAILSLPLALLSDSAQPAKERIAGLINQLGSDKYADREKATQELNSIGPVVLPQLRAAAHSGSSEARQRIQQIIKRLEDRLTAETLLAPRMITLDFMDTPVTAAAEELQKQSGYRFVIQPLADRRITLKTGEVPFWQAVDKLCQVGSLEDLTMATITLRDRKPSVFPTCYHGALRLRLVGTPSNKDPFSRQFKHTEDRASTDTAGFMLEVSAESPLRWFSILGSPKITRAEDDLGQVFSSIPDEVDQVQVTNWSKPLSPLDDVGLSREAPFRFALGPRKASRINVLAGTVSLQVFTPIPEPFIIVDNVLDSKGRVVKGQNGGFIEVLSIEEFDDQIEMRICHQFPPDHYPARGELGGIAEDDGQRKFGKVRFELMRQNLALDADRSEFRPHFNEGLPALQDQDGRIFKRYEINQVKHELDKNNIKETITMSFSRDKTVGAPARLVMYGHRLINVTIPFRFETLPLK